MGANHRPSAGTQAAILQALRGAPAPPAPSEPELEAALRRYECGGYLAWTRRRNGASPWPAPWDLLVARAHHKTLVDNLVALSLLRRIAATLSGLGVPFIVLKGAAYAAELYDDPGARPLTDLDLLIPERAVVPVARRLRADGFEGEVGVNYPEDRRFEMWLPGPGACRVEFHWALGRPGLMHAGRDDPWRRARTLSLDDAPVQALSIDLTLAFHVSHLADHYFGPTLKWVLDLREMLRSWRPEPEALRETAARTGIRTALHLAVAHLARLFPGEAAAPGPEAIGVHPRRVGRLDRFLSPEPLELLIDLETVALGRSRFRLAAADGPFMEAHLALRRAGRPLGRLWHRLRGAAAPPWEGVRAGTPG